MPTPAATYTSREKLAVYIGVLLGFMFDGYDILIISFLLVPMAASFHVGVPVIALGITLTLVASIIGGIFFGWVADSIGRKPTLFITIVVFGVSTLLTGFVTNIPELYILRFITGLGVGGEWGIGFTLLTEAWSEKSRGAAGGFLASMYVFGGIAGVLTAAFTLPLFGAELGWRYAFMIAGGLALVLLSMRFFMPESKVWLEYNNAKKKGLLPPGYSLKSPVLEIFSRKFIRYTLCGTAMACGYLFFTYSFLSFMPTYFSSVFKISIPVYSEMILIAQLFSVVGYVFNGFLADIIGRKKDAIVYGIICFIAIAFFWLEAATPPTFSSIITFPVFFAYMAVYFSAGFTAEFGIWIGEHFATKLRATGSNFAYMVGRGLGAGFAPIIVPLWSNTYGLGVAIAIGMMIGAIIQFVAIIGLKETKGTKITAL
ncbi:MAG TPA: MFS transporter [Candidatus Bathyarchaeia archaeon]|nr:MFS transporter [Candidatus Bathyarchaeia archaeon]